MIMINTSRRLFLLFQLQKEYQKYQTQRKNKTFDTLKSLTHQDSDSLGNNSMMFGCKKNTKNTNSKKE